MMSVHDRDTTGAAMARLLHIDSSALSSGSVSKEIAATFRQAWQDAHPGGEIVHRDLGRDPVPPLGEPAIQAAILGVWVPAQAATAGQAAAVDLRTRLAQELLDADAYLLSVPMYNWGVPATFKAWLDQVIINGRTVTQAD